MPHHEIDISWQVLRRIVHDWTGQAAELEEVKPLGGGYISTTLAIRTQDNHRAVLKISPHRVDRSYEQEAHQLNFLRRLGLPVPEVYACRTGTLEEPFSYVLMEFISGVDFTQAKKLCTVEQFEHLQAHLAEVVLSMHQHTSGHYGRITASPSAQVENWPAFYREIYDSVVQEAQKNMPLPAKSRKLIAKVHSRLDQLLAHGDCPRLVHWDIWSSNLLAQSDSRGRWWVLAMLDPNCKFAHAEAELAYMELFGTAGAAFFGRYQQTRRLDEQYHRCRKSIYQLYALMNQVRLFGGDYLRPLNTALDRLSKII